MDLNFSYIQGRAIHVDKHLSNVAVNYRPEGFIGDQVFPIVNVEHRSDMIKTYNQADLFRINNTIRAPGTSANRVSYQVGSDSYRVQNYALKDGIVIEDRVNADPAFIRDTEQGKVFFLSDQLKLDWDRRLALNVTSSSNVGTAANVASAWITSGVPDSNAKPLYDIWAKMDQVQDATGYRPNRVLFSGKAWRNFKRHPQVIDKANATALTGAGLEVTLQQAAMVLDVEKVLVGEGYYNNADEGISLYLQRIWGDNVLIYYNQSRPSLDLPSFGYTFRWAARGLANWNVERHPYDSDKKSDDLEIGYYQQEKVVAKPLSALISWTGSSQ